MIPPIDMLVFFFSTNSSKDFPSGDTRPNMASATPRTPPDATPLAVRLTIPPKDSPSSCFQRTPGNTRRKSDITSFFKLPSNTSFADLSGFVFGPVSIWRASLITVSRISFSFSSFSISFSSLSMVFCLTSFSSLKSAFVVSISVLYRSISC